MCGIVGFTGVENGVDIVLEGLKRLEYRGYDSAGISLKEDGKLTFYKEEGALSNLRGLLDKVKPVGNIAIGHTRWATHGVVNQVNAHPHCNDLFSIVHNGIIENAASLKEMLIEEGFDFKSETDSETFLVLLTRNYKQGQNISEAIAQTFKSIEGNSALVIINKMNNDIYAIKRSAPLVCGADTKKSNFYVSSDPYALVGFAEKLIFPSDEVICHLTQDGIKFTELDGSKSDRVLRKDQNMSLDISTKGDFPHFMLKEIFEQPELIRRLVQFYQDDKGADYLKDIQSLDIAHIYTNACGTAWHAGLVFKNHIEELTKHKINVELASEFRYRKHNFQPNDIGLFISQSGETADTLACQELCLENKLRTFSIINVEGSAIYRNSNINFPILAGAEIGVASTKAFTLQSLVGWFLANSLSGKELDNGIADECEVLASRIEELLSEEDVIKKVAKEIYNYKGFLFTGRGSLFPIALEGALKLKEIAYVHAEGYAAGELKHGPIALVDEEMVNIALVGKELYEKAVSNAEEVKARKGVMVVVGPKDDEALAKIADHYIGLTLDGLDNLAPLYMNIVMQLLSYYIAREKGTDIDKPRNLAKSVTVE